jgi:hypothetical protein
MIVGMPSLTVSLRMYAAHDQEHFLSLCQKEIVESLLSTLKKCDSSLEVDISTTPAGRTKHTTIAIYSVPKKTPEKNGAQ